ncbi:hypothetical protein SCLCIDRAFT_1211283 [Scleroderma citrinum Foug A]|uniref:Uncharacterized protein n=1 Tax=Scleroderma citrinum Foug A TaxID=1036808 RepID=A0A0C3ANH5_9AGAM|nr:hypothetical protein SCLCIDRAFT_1211283 [Scleroderma citrinum Foug A]
MSDGCNKWMVSPTTSLAHRLCTTPLRGGSPLKGALVLSNRATKACYGSRGKNDPRGISYLFPGDARLERSKWEDLCSQV